MSRLIDADMLCETLEHSRKLHKGENYLIGILGLICDLINNQPTAEPNHWIPFDGTYPKITEGTISHGFVTLKRENRRFVIKMIYTNIDGFLHINGRPIKESMITAYMFEEYPEPYKEEADTNG